MSLTASPTAPGTAEEVAERAGSAVLSDMGMMCVSGGVERGLAEYDARFAASGWRRGKTYPVGAGYFGMELDAV